MMSGSNRLKKLSLVSAGLLSLVAYSACSDPTDPDDLDPNGEGPVSLSSIAPISGTPYGGTVITLTGDGFKDIDRVSVGGVDCTPVVFKSAKEISCTNGQHAPGKVDVVVTRKDIEKARLQGAFNYACSTSGAVGLNVWANEGGEKITQDAVKATCSAEAVLSSVWDGTRIKLFGAKNETLGFNLVIESPNAPTSGVSVELAEMNGPGGAKLRGGTVSYTKFFDWTSREIELFFVEYLPIKGLSKIHFNYDDERQVPRAFQRPWTQTGIGAGTWQDRPDHDKNYPDILAPLDTKPTFNIAANQNQSVWGDIYVPVGSPAGLYSGTIVVKQNGNVVKSVPIELNVRNFELPEQPFAKTMVYTGYGDLVRRYFGVDDLGLTADQPAARAKMAAIYDRHWMMAHRHRISLIDENFGEGLWDQDRPRPEWEGRLSGALFTPAHGYAGPGMNVGNNVYAIGAYGKWSWIQGDEAAMHAHTDGWESWFQAQPYGNKTERFLFLVDEPPASVYPTVQKWTQWMKNNPGPGRALKSFSAVPLLDAAVNFPGLDIIASLMAVGDPTQWQTAIAALKSRGGKLFMYNGKRPASGSMATEDDGVAMREHAWGQYKMEIDRWFIWQSTYYNNYQGGIGQSDLFHNAQTFGSASQPDTIAGRTSFGNPYGNGDGVLFFPGTDLVNTADNHAVEGPMASLRLKLWRRGIQDVDYLAKAAAINPTRVKAIVNRMVPKVMWEVGVDNPADPSYVHADISWSIKPGDWEAARAELADIIEGK